MNISKDNILTIIKEEIKNILEEAPQRGRIQGQLAQDFYEDPKLSGHFARKKRDFEKDGWEYIGGTVFIKETIPDEEDQLFSLGGRGWDGLEIRSVGLPIRQGVFAHYRPSGDLYGANESDWYDARPSDLRSEQAKANRERQSEAQDSQDILSGKEVLVLSSDKNRYVLASFPRYQSLSIDTIIGDLKKDIVPATVLALYLQMPSRFGIYLVDTLNAPRLDTLEKYTVRSGDKTILHSSKNHNKWEELGGKWYEEMGTIRIEGDEQFPTEESLASFQRSLSQPVPYPVSKYSKVPFSIQDNLKLEDFEEKSSGQVAREIP